MPGFGDDVDHAVRPGSRPSRRTRGARELILTPLDGPLLSLGSLYWKPTPPCRSRTRVRRIGPWGSMNVCDEGAAPSTLISMVALPPDRRRSVADQRMDVPDSFATQRSSVSRWRRSGSSPPAFGRGGSVRRRAPRPHGRASAAHTARSEQQSSHGPPTRPIPARSSYCQRGFRRVMLGRPSEARPRPSGPSTSPGRPPRETLQVLPAHD